MINITLRTNGELYRRGKSKFGKIIDGKRRALDRRLAYYRQELPLTAAKDFRNYIADIILSQDPSYMGGYPAHSSKYKDKIAGTGFWENTSETLHDIQSSPIVSIGNSATYSAFTLEFSDRTQRIIRWMEYGTSKMPARPLFGPAFRRFSISFFNQTGTVIRDLVNAWSRG